MELVDPTEVEQRLAEAFILGQEFSADDGPVRAEVLARIVGSPSEHGGWPQPALRLRQARITGRLSLAFTRVERPLLLADCEFEETPEIYWAHLAFVRLERCRPSAGWTGWAGCPRGPPPQPYEQLAAVYRRLGHDEHARAVLLAKQRRQTATGRWPTRAWGWLQDVTVGYGYRPQRALAWLAALLLTGAITFGLHPPQPVDADGGARFNPVLYTVDLLVPVVSLGQEEHFSPDPGQQWLVYLLIAAGWVLATTAATGIGRAASRS